MNIKVFNMEFGESILLEDRDEQLLVDCGSKKGKELEERVNIISNELDEQKTISFMITHFHEDHYNGYQKVYKKKLYFPKASYIYMPWICFKNDKIPVIINEAIYLYMLYKRDSDRKSFLFWLKGQIEFILYSGNDQCRLVLLKEGDKFTVGSREMEVLWPAIIDVEENDSDVQWIFEFVEKSIKYEDIKDFKYYKEKMAHNIMKVYRIAEDYCQQDDDGYVNGLIIKQQKALLEHILNDQQNCLYALNNIRKRITWEEKEREKYKNELKNIFKRDNNACSIVFRDCYKNCPINNIQRTKKYDILMTGDITVDIIENRLHDKYLKNTQYKYIKCPHHGTKSHYTNAIPVGDNLIISNGSGCRTYQCISLSYSNHGNVLSRKYCTNSRCESYHSHQFCRDFDSNSSCSTRDFYSITINSDE